MTSGILARRALCALGLLLLAGIGRPAAAQSPADPLQQPLWEFGATATTAADSVPARLNRYQLLSFTGIPNPNTLTGIFNDELGGYDVARWRLGHWVPTLTGTNKYQEPPAFNSLTPGFGYWLITKDSVKVRFNADPVPADTFELPLLQGPNGAAEWNQLGNPFAFNVSTANMRVVKRDSLFTVPQASTAGYVDGNLRTWNPNTQSFGASGTINRAQGFWAQVKDPDVSLKWTRWVAAQGAGSLFGLFSSVKLDSKGNPHIAFYDDGNGALWYATRVNNTWTSIIIDNGTPTTNYVGGWASLELDSLDLPYIAYQHLWQQPYFIRKQTNGTWTTPEALEPGSTNNGWGIRLKLFHGVPRVVYYDATNGKLKYAERAGGGGWNIFDAIDPQSYSPPDYFIGGLGFSISSQGVPHILCQTQGTPRAVRYSTRNGSTWTSTTIDSTPGGDTGFTPSVAVDATGAPHVSYYAAAAGESDLKYGKKTGTTWTIETVDATGNTGLFSSINVTTLNEPVIAYMEFASTGVPTRIKLARRGTGSWPQPEIVDDVNIPQFYAYVGSTLDPNNQPRVTYFGLNASNQYQMRYAEKTGPNIRLKVAPVAVAPNEPALAKPDGAAWALAITARQDGRASETMLLGTAVSAANLAALRSTRAPAPPGGELLSLTVSRDGDELVRDFDLGAETMRWTIRTAGGVAPGEQTFTFEGLDVPEGVRFFLADPENGWTREVQAGGSVSLAARPRTLELTATTGSGPGTKSLRDGLSFAYPNPFADRTGFAFTLTRAADLRVDLYDLGGRRVRTIERAAASAGEHVLVWDGRDADGRAVPSGVYLAQWRAGDARGARRIVRVE